MVKHGQTWSNLAAADKVFKATAPSKVMGIDAGHMRSSNGCVAPPDVHFPPCSGMQESLGRG